MTSGKSFFSHCHFQANPTVHHNCDGGNRFLVHMNDSLHVGHALRELKEHVHPDQREVYCHVLSKKRLAKNCRAGVMHILYNYERPVGKNTKTEYLPERSLRYLKD